MTQNNHVRARTVTRGYLIVKLVECGVVDRHRDVWFCGSKGGGGGGGGEEQTLKWHEGTDAQGRPSCNGNPFQNLCERILYMYVGYIISIMS